MTLDQAAELMGVTSRHTRRILAAYRERGAAALAHGHRGRRPVNATPEALVVGAPVAALLACGACGPGICRASKTVSDRPSAVHSAPVSVQARSCGTRIDTGPGPAGSTVSSHRSLRSSTPAASVTVPPLTSSAWSRMSSGVISTSALNVIRNVNALDPSWLAGMSSRVTVRGSASVAFDTAPYSVGRR